MAQDLLSIVLAGIQKGEKDAKEKERKKALANFIQSLDTLTRGEQDQGQAPEAAPVAPQPPQMPMEGPTSPQLPLPPDMSGFGQMSPVGTPPVSAGPLSAAVSPPVSPIAGAGQMERIRQGLFPALTQAGDYAPEAVQMIHNLFGGNLFKEGGYGTVPAEGSVFSKETGAITGQAPSRAAKATYGVSPGGWLTVITPDGAGGFSTQELTGVKPTDIVKEGMKGQTARDVATIRGKYAVMTAQERTNAAKTVAQIRQAAGDKINSPAKLYTYLAQKWINGTANTDEINVLKHIEPVIIKMGGLQMLMNQEQGVDPTSFWDGLPPEQQPTPEEKEEVSWWQKILNPGSAKTEPSGATVPGVPPGAAKTSSTGPQTPAGKPRAVAEMTLGGKKYNMTPPNSYSNIQIRSTLEKVEKAIKQDNKDPQAIVNILRQNGWTID